MIGGMCFSRRTILIEKYSSAARKEAGFLLLWLIFFPAFLRLLFNAINYGTAAAIRTKREEEEPCVPRLAHTQTLQKIAWKAIRLRWGKPFKGLHTLDGPPSCRRAAICHGGLIFISSMYTSEKKLANTPKAFLM